MAVLMANASEVSSREHVQYLYNKNVELETKRRKSAQDRIPSDPIVLQQMRENFETIILEDHAFSEQHEIELALWQLHYRQIEEIRANFSAAMAAVSSLGHGGKACSTRPDRVAKIRSQLKTFLSEATGFYHELMVKIRVKYGLPLGHFSDDTENKAFISTEGNRSAELKKALISCHRCLIYLGDLARYKGMYGEDELKLRDFAAASSYYMQAIPFWPSSGNPHHQLAILSSYSDDEFVAIYRYFRSLAVENPFSMARDNLIIAFEKNRLNFSQLIGGAKTSAFKPLPMRMNGKGRPRAEARFSGKDHKVEARPVKERVTSTCTIKTFSAKFVRLNGILFTRTSMETFVDVLSMAKNDFLELLSSHSEDFGCFGSDAAECELYIVRLVAIIIFSVHNAKRDSEDQLRAEILQRAVLLQNAYAAAYEFMGLITERCLKLQDPLSSFVLPGVLVFAEWLACCPEAVHFNEDNKLAEARAFFWKNCISIFNKLVSSPLQNNDEFWFFNTSECKDGEMINRLALWEDFELRGFLPLQPAQKIRDFSRKSSFGVEDVNKEKKARVQRIIAAGKTFSGVIRVGEQFIYFDPKLKRFVIGEKPLSCDFALRSSEKPLVSSDGEKYFTAEKRMDLVDLKPSLQLFLDGEDEEEEIVFKPSAADKIADARIPALISDNVLGTVADGPACKSRYHAAFVPPAVADFGQCSPDASATTSLPLYNGVAQHALSIQPKSSKWQLQKEASIIDGFRDVSLMENGHFVNMKMQDQNGVLQPLAFSLPFEHAVKRVMPSKYQSNLGCTTNGASAKPESLLTVGAKKNPVSRPLRHVGPPPGFNRSEHSVDINMKDDDICIMDDYSWLDGYQMPSTNLFPDLDRSCNLSRQASHMTEMVSFPFPGKQFSGFHVSDENSNVQQDHHFSQPMNLFQEQNQHILQTGNHQAMPQEKQFQGQSLWDSRFLV